MLAITIINFATGLLFSVVAFIFRLPGIIFSFSPNPVSGLAFFAVSAAGAAAVVASFMALMVGASAGVVIAIAGLPRLQGGSAYAGATPPRPPARVTAGYAATQPQPQSQQQQRPGGGRPHDE